MAAPRAVLRSSRLISSRICTATQATRPSYCHARVAVNERLYTSSSRSFQETVSTPSRGDEVPLTSFTKSPSGSQARTIILRSLPKRAVRSEVEELFRSKGLEITKLQLLLDRFTFHNMGSCFIELSSEEQVQKALKVLHNTEFKQSNIRAAPVQEDFVWFSREKSNAGRWGPRLFVDEGANASEALRPLLEGRRKLFAVQPPGWLQKDSSAGHNAKARQVIHDHLGKYGVETVGQIEPFFGDKKSHPRMLCFIDFATKDGADQAAEGVHDTEIEDRKVWLSPIVMAPWRAHHVGKVDAALLAELQEKGLASKEVYEDKFANSDRKKGAKNHNTTRLQREMKKRKAEGAEGKKSEA